jgi:Domain of unknown function (DUF4352)
MEVYPPDGPQGMIFTNTAGGALLRASFRSRVWRPALVRAGLLGQVREVDGKFEAAWSNELGLTMVENFGNGLFRTDTAGDPTNPYLTATAQGEFTIVSLTVTNIGTQSQAFDTIEQKLVDSSGRHYDSDNDATACLNTTGLYINPGNSVHEKVAFDIPSTASPNAIELHGGSWSGGAKVALS